MRFLQNIFYLIGLGRDLPAHTLRVVESKLTKMHVDLCARDGEVSHCASLIAKQLIKVQCHKLQMISNGLEPARCRDMHQRKCPILFVIVQGRLNRSPAGPKTYPLWQNKTNSGKLAVSGPMRWCNDRFGAHRRSGSRGQLSLIFKNIK
jgi:hypothetical protein